VAGNPAPQATRALTVAETGPGIAINAIASDNIINASEAANAGGVIISGTATDGSGTGVNGQTVTVQILNSSNTVVDSYTTTASGGTWSVDVTKAQAQGLTDGSYTVTANVSDVAGNPAPQATRALTVAETGPGIAINAIASDNIINASEAANAGGVIISGTATDGSGTGVNGQTVTVQILNSSNTVVDSYTTTASGGTWSVDVTKAQAQGLTDGSYTVTANVSDVAGNPAPQATRALTVAETGPGIAINAIASDNIINASEAANAGGVIISGTATDGSGTGVNGQTVTVQILNSSNTVVDSYTTTASGGTWSVDVTKAQAQGLTDGSYTVTANVSDVAGNPAPQATRALTVAETGPGIAINAIASDNIINASEAANAGGVIISGTATDGSGTGVNGQTVTVQILNSSNTVVDSYTTTASGGTWSVDVTKAQAQGLTDGSYTVTANVSDVAGNPAPQATRALTVAETGPGIAINAIASDNIINASEAANAGGVIISGTATDGSGTGVNGQTVTVQILNSSNTVVDSYTTTASGGTWSVDVTKAQAQGLTDGSYTVTANVSDVAGNPAPQATRALTVAETGPGIAINAIASDNIINASEAANAGGVIISGTATDGSGTGVNGQTVTVQILNSSNTVVDSYTTTASGGTWSVDVTKAQAQGLTDGSYTVTANVSDVAGNPAPQATRALTVAETGPGIAINAIASDNIINASEAANAGGVIISGTATDGSGTGVNGQTVTVQILNSSNTVVDSYTTTASGGTWSVDVTKAQAQGLTDGSYTVTANVSDVAGNPAPQATRALTVAETGPGIAINAIASDNIINASEAANAGGVIISGTATDGSGTGVNGQTVTVQILNSSNTVVDSYTTTASGGTWSVDVTKAQAQGLTDGSYTVTANVSDVAGNPAPQATRALTVAETGPGIAINAIASDNIINASEAANAGGVIISGTATDGSGTGVNGQTVTVQILNSSNTVVDSYTTTASGGTWSVDVTKAQAQGLTDGSYTVTANVSDVAGNPAPQATRALTVDETAPSITIATIAGDNIINASEESAVIVSGTTSGVETGQVVTVTLSDTNSHTVTTHATVNGGVWTATAAKLTGVIEGPITVADVTDLASNPRRANRTLTLDDVGPGVTATTRR
jgi:gamma-glutamyl-gamma-aminobutyrate hydrolase PuuD